ncbi:MAG: histidine triad nucleotide-binding protein [Anaerolineae bacterium]|jgi:histidine triad (HIT) family protein|nr:histidine triad nucleotide-binding protein [Anaerolineae bacterium]
MSADCIFCKIIAKEIPGDILYEDEQVIAFRDIQPAAPIHILIVPKKHIPSINEATEEDERLLGHLHLVAKKIAQEEGIAERGYRLVINTGKEGGQIIFHIHLHLMGGKKLKTPKYL